MFIYFQALTLKLIAGLLFLEFQCNKKGNRSNDAKRKTAGEAPKEE